MPTPTVRALALHSNHYEQREKEHASVFNNDVYSAWGEPHRHLQIVKAIASKGRAAFKPPKASHVAPGCTHVHMGLCLWSKGHRCPLYTYKFPAPDKTPSQNAFLHPKPRWYK